ncbi:hypothetical protein O3M35_007259 [Rhynocoris fuscipes]|uniref:Lipase domain-containing protein n=1 Tax=Rhynocoris fuscipes TaxID=488301 RepID=A0AAW1D8R1_9HEMI
MIIYIAVFVYFTGFISNALSQGEYSELELMKSYHDYELLESFYNYDKNGVPVNYPFQLEFSFLDVKNYVRFYLYNKNDHNDRIELKINDTSPLRLPQYWKPGAPVKIFIHGYVGNSTVPQMEMLKNKLLERNEGLNVIALDYGPLAHKLYPIAAHYSEDVGKIGSQLIDFLIENGAKTTDFHVIGLSLGAHIAGFVGYNVKSGKIARVTALDAPTIGFIIVGKHGRVDKDDAEFVDCIHTCSGTASFMEHMCHADFYPNGGKSPQPGCGTGVTAMGCSHVRSQDYFTESAEKGHLFYALTCQELTKDGPNDCVDEGALMGYPADQKLQGIFYVETGSKYPFSNTHTTV